MSLSSFFSKFFKAHQINYTSGKNVFDHYFFDLKYYLHKDASIEDFSSLLKISPQVLDQISISYYGSSFQAILNMHRYQHFLKEIESPINSNLPIESIIQLSGFSSNEKFVKYFEAQNELIK